MTIAELRPARWLAVAAILVCCVGCDQYSKRVAQSTLRGQQPRSFCGDLFRLEYAENPGAFLGLGGQLPPAARWVMLVGLNLVLSGVIAGMLLVRRDATPLWTIAAALLLSGAIGNLIDRMSSDGLVIDFMNLGIGPLRTGIFNVADAAISTGAVLLAWPLLKKQ